MSKKTAKSVEQKGAEAEVEGFRKELGPFVIAAETTRMAMVFTDARAPSHPIIFANDSALALSGYDRETLLGQPFTFLLTDGDGSEAIAQVDSAFSDGGTGEVELCYRRKDGGTYWAATVISAVSDKSGNVVQHFASFMDVSRHRLEEEHLRFLLDELNHRTQNTLATVQAIAAQTLRGHADKLSLETFEGRILALAKAHSLLGRENWVAVSLQDVLGQILRPFGIGDSGGVRFAVEGPAVRLQPKSALTLAMVFHELATNAAKYGALSVGDTGKVAIAWRIEPTAEGERMRLRWVESGGPRVMPPGRRGFGSRLIE